MAQFERYIGVDYAGAETPTSKLTGLRVYAAERESSPVEIRSPVDPRGHWTRKDLAEWLRDELLQPRPTLVGIDHAFSFPLPYFEVHGLPPDWPAFLDDFRRHWPTDEDIYVDFVREGIHGNGASRMGDPTWLRLTERWTSSAKSVFKFDVPGSVAKSTHAGLPWLHYLRAQCGQKVHFWPFDGWQIPSGLSAVAEVYPSLWMKRIANEGERTLDQQAACAVATWFHRSASNGSLEQYLNPPLDPHERLVAEIEGWILGVL